MGEVGSSRLKPSRSTGKVGAGSAVGGLEIVGMGVRASMIRGGN